MRLNNIPKFYYCTATILLWTTFSVLMYFQHHKREMDDFVPVYIASKLTSYPESIRIHIYDHNPIHFDRVNKSVFHTLTKKSGIDRKVIHPYVYPPFIAWQMKPLARFDYEVSKRIVLILNILFFSAGFFLLCATINPRNYKFLLILAPVLFAFFFPFKYSLGLGQTTPFIFLLLAIAYYFSNRKNDLISGLILGYCASIKISPVLILIPLILAKKYRIVIACAISIILFFSSNILIGGWDLTRLYIDRIAEIFLKTGFPAWNNVSFQAMIMRFTLPVGSIFWYFPVKLDLYQKVTEYALIIVTICVSAYSIVKQKQFFHDENVYNGFIWSNGVILSLLIPKITWNHYYIYMLIPFLWIINQACKIKNNKMRISLYVFTAVLWICIGIETIPAASALFNGITVELHSKIPGLIFSLPLISGICVLAVLNIGAFFTRNKNI